MGGINLTDYDGWFNKYPNDPTRNSYTLQDLVQEEGTLHTWNEIDYPELGDMVFFNDPYHTGVVAEIHNEGQNVEDIFVVQASYSKGIINKLTLNEWQKKQ